MLHDTKLHHLQLDNGQLSWALCLATLNRPDMLEACVSLALSQTRLPAEVIIVDASDDWRVSRDRIAALIQGADANVNLIYQPARKRSSSAQRHDAVNAASADVLFLFDDDTLMHSTCAHEIMKVYEVDPQGAIAAVSASPTTVVPKGDMKVPDVEKKTIGNSGGIGGAIKRWLLSEVFMMSITQHFVPYDDRPMVPYGEHAIGDEGAVVGTVPLIGGYAMTVRRSVAQEENFDDNLLASSPGEDLDVSYRFSRKGLNVMAPHGLVHHYEAAAGRVNRKVNTRFYLMNSAFLLHKNSQNPAHRRGYYIHGARRIFAEFLKDVASRRFSLPQFRGAWAGVWTAREIFSHPQEGLGPWYENLQKTILAEAKR